MTRTALPMLTFFFTFIAAITGIQARHQCIGNCSEQSAELQVWEEPTTDEELGWGGGRRSNEDPDLPETGVHERQQMAERIAAELARRQAKTAASP